MLHVPVPYHTPGQWCPCLSWITEINKCFYTMNRLTIFMHISMVGILELKFLYSLPFVEHCAVRLLRGCISAAGSWYD